jgi:hypothetical protein
VSIATILQKLRALRVLPQLAAAEAAPRIEQALKTTAAAGTTPSGEAWAPRKDGSRALANAAQAVTATAAEATVHVRLEGTSTGDAKAQGIQNAKRRIIPQNGEPLPEAVSKAAHEGVEAAFRKAVR